MKLFIDFFKCGKIQERSNPLTPRVDYIIQDINSIIDFVIPHFDSYSLNNVKQKDFEIFKKAIFLLQFSNYSNRKEILKQIKELSLTMNSNREE